MLLVLAGCLDVNAAVQVDSDDRITGTMVVTISRDIAAQAGITSASDLAEQVAGSDLPDGIEVRTTAGEDELAVTLTGDLSSTEGLLTVKRDGQVQAFTVANAANPEQADPSTDATASREADYRIEVVADFAGTVTELSGDGAQELDANTVLFSGPLLEQWRAGATIDLDRPVPAASDTVSATPVAAPLSAAPGLPRAALPAIAVLAVAGLAAAAVVVRRQSRSRH